jgi:hypothetical protein
MKISCFGDLNTLIRTQVVPLVLFPVVLSHERPGPGEGPDVFNLDNDHGHHNHSSRVAQSTKARIATQATQVSAYTI